MTQIATKEVELTKGEFFLITASNLLGRRWLLVVALIAVTACLLCLQGLRLFSGCMLLFTVFYPAWVVWYAWRFAVSSENKLVYEKRRFEFDDKFIKGWLTDGSHTEIRYEHVTRAVKSRKYYLLYLSKTQVICIPFLAFPSGEDIHALDTLLRSKHLL